MPSLSNSKPSSQIDSQFQLLYKRQPPEQLNLFNLQQSNRSLQKPNTRQSMIHKIKKQTEQLKEIKRTISTVSVSRLAKMQRLKDNTKRGLIEKGQFYQLNEKGNQRLGNSISIKTKLNMFNFNGKVNDERVKQNFRNHQNDNFQVKNDNPQDSIFQIQLMQNNMHQIQPQQKIQHHTKTQSITQVRKQPLSLTKNHNAKIISQHPSTDYPPNIKLLTQRSRSELRLRSSSSSTLTLSRSKRDEMTLNLRKQLHQMQSRQKLVQNKVRLIEKQISFKLEKKIKENTKLMQKHKGLYELIHTRMERQRQKSELAKRKNQEKRFVHESKLMKVNIEKLTKRQFTQQEKKIQRNRSQQSLLDLTYKQFLKQKEALSNQENIAFRMSFVKDFQAKDLVASKMSYYGGDGRENDSLHAIEM